MFFGGVDEGRVLRQHYFSFESRFDYNRGEDFPKAHDRANKEFLGWGSC